VLSVAAPNSLDLTGGLLYAAEPVGVLFSSCNSLLSPTSVLDFLETWVAGGLGLSGLGLGVGLGLPQAPQSPCEFVSVGHVWAPIGSSAFSVCSFLFFFTSINIFCFQQSARLRTRVIVSDASMKRAPTSTDIVVRLLSLSYIPCLPIFLSFNPTPI
jgi:hypothetical protein